MSKTVNQPNSHSTSAVVLDRYMGLDIMFDTDFHRYYVTDVNGNVYYGQSPKHVRSIMDSHGRRVLKRKAYQPRRMIATQQLRQVW